MVTQGDNHVYGKITSTPSVGDRSPAEWIPNHPLANAEYLGPEPGLDTNKII